jgi:tight adherence protein B
MVDLLAALTTGAAMALFLVYFVRRGLNRPADLRIRNLVDRPEAAKKGLSWDEVRRRGPSSLPYIRDWLLESNWARRMSVELDQAGSKLRVGEYLAIRFACGIVPFALIWAAGRSLPTFFLGLLVGAAGFMVPAFVLRQARRSRIDRIGHQLPEAATMMSNALRAGFAFQHGFTMVAEQMEPPIADEFNRTLVDMNVGMSAEDALAGLLARTNSEEMNLLVTAMLVQRSSGGNLAEVLENVGEQMRERERIYGEVRTLTAQQRYSGMVLVFWPLLVLAGFSLFNWDQTSLLFTTTAGLVLLGVGAIMQMMGFITIRRILDINL